MQRVRLAVIGAGCIGAKHASMARRNEACLLVGIADPDLDRRAVADELGVPFYRCMRELLHHADPEGVIIATPNATHATVATACAERGLHMLIEKPVADTLENARRIVAAAKDSSASVLVGHHRRHNPLVRKARDLVRGGALGRLAGFSALWTLLKPDDYFEVAWRRERPGGGPLLINLIHDIDSVRFICGEVTSVYARMNSAARGLPVEDSLSLSLTLDNGALGTILASDATPAPWSYEATTSENPAYHHVPENCYHFVGTAASLAFPRMELWRYPEGGGRGWTEPLEQHSMSVPAVDPLVAQLEHLCRVVREEEEPLVSAEEGARSLAVALAAQASAETGMPVDPMALWDSAGGASGSS